MGTPCYIFDIDGTLANNSHRTHHLQKQPKDWDAYHALAQDDTPIAHIVNLVKEFRSEQIVYCSGRHTGQKDLTVRWLQQVCGLAAVPRRLYMRNEGDHRPDHIIKLELLAQIRADGFEPIMAFDDRNSVVKMWRDAGVPCAQVAEGDF
jgi:phosphoglycolate phosphatase-like HAD superfamily hydrolase